MGEGKHISDSALRGSKHISDSAWVAQAGGEGSEHIRDSEWGGSSKHTGDSE